MCTNMWLCMLCMQMRVLLLRHGSCFILQSLCKPWTNPAAHAGIQKLSTLLCNARAAGSLLISDGPR